MYIKTLKTA